MGLAGLPWLEKIGLMQSCTICDDVELAFERPNRVDDCSGKDVRKAGRCLNLRIAASLDGALFSLSSKRSTSIVVSCKNTSLEFSVLLIWVMVRLRICVAIILIHDFKGSRPVKIRICQSRAQTPAQDNGSSTRRLADDVSDEDRVGNSLLQIWKLRFGPKA